MKKFWRNMGVLAVLAVVSSPAHGHHTSAFSLAAETQGAGPVSRNSSTVNVQTFQFKPSQLQVKAGSQVTWTNQDDIRHTVTSGAPEKKDGRFDAPLAGKDKSFSFTFSQPGTYTYFCDRHQHMRGEIEVR